MWKRKSQFIEIELKIAVPWYHIVMITQNIGEDSFVGIIVSYEERISETEI